jgi:YNFM family putative membrane transporter
VRTIGTSGPGRDDGTRDRVDEGYLAGSAAYRRVVAALFVAGIATFALLYSTQAVLPDLATTFGVSAAASTLTVSLATAGLGVALLVAGPLSDRVGRTRLVHLSLGAACLVAFAGALAPTWPVLLTLRTLEGVALAGLPAVATAYLREELHPGTHARAAGLYIGGTALGGMTGRLLTGAVAEAAGWRWALASSALLAAVCAVLVWLLLPASRRFEPAPTVARATLSMTVRALSDPALLKLYAVGGLAMGALVAVFNTIGFRLEAPPFHLGLGAASLVFLTYPLGSVSSAVAGRAADRWGRRAVLPVGGLVAVSGLAVSLVDSLPVVVLGTALLVVGFFAVHGVASGWVPARAHAGAVSTAQAASFYLFTYYAGSSVFGSLAGAAWSLGAWPAVVALASVLMLATVALAVSLKHSASLLTR